MKILPLAEAKAKLSELVAEVSQTDEEISITRNGRAAAVLVSHDGRLRQHLPLRPVKQSIHLQPARVTERFDKQAFCRQAAFCPMSDVIERCAALPQREFRAGEPILEEGKRSGLLYILASGSVEVLKGDLQVATVDTPGAFFGEVSALLDVPHMATVRALTDAKLFVAADSLAFLESHKEIALSVARLLAKRLHSVTTYLVDLKRQFEGQESHLSMVDEVLETLVHHQGVESEPGSDRYPDPKVE